MMFPLTCLFMVDFPARVTAFDLMPGHTSCTPLRRKMLRFTDKPLATASQSEFSLQDAQHAATVGIVQCPAFGHLMASLLGDSTDSSRSTLKKAQQFFFSPTCWSAHPPERNYQVFPAAKCPKLGIYSQSKWPLNDGATEGNVLGVLGSSHSHDKPDVGKLQRRICGSPTTWLSGSHHGILYASAFVLAAWGLGNMLWHWEL